MTNRLDTGFVGTILVAWKNNVSVVSKSLKSNLLDTNVLNFVRVNVKILISFVLQGLNIIWLRLTQLLLRKDRTLGIKELEKKNHQAGKEIMLDTQVFMIGWNGNLESLGYANSVELNPLKNTTGLIRVENIKGIYQTGNAFA
jgi:hypothetical protein